MTGITLEAAYEWNSYTPEWRNGGPGPGNASLSLGNGSITGQWTGGPDSVRFSIRLLRGTTTNVGTEEWWFSLPVPARDWTAAVVSAAVLNAGVWFPAIAVSQYSGDTQGVFVATRGSSGTGFIGGNPGPSGTNWDVADEVRISGFYRPAVRALG